MNWYPLCEGKYIVGRNKTKSTNGKGKQSKEQHVTVHITPFLVKTNTDTILLDTGLGRKEENRNSILLKNLKKNNTKENDITKILISHLHKDHTGGIFRNSDSSSLLFYNAFYFIQKDELVYARSNSSYATLNKTQLEVLENSSQVVLLTEERGTIGDNIYYEKTKAHTPHHQVFWVKEGEKTIFFGGDDAPQSKQMKIRSMAKYDFNSRKAMDLRKKWTKELESENATILFYHDKY